MPFPCPDTPTCFPLIHAWESGTSAARIEASPLFRHGSATQLGKIRSVTLRIAFVRHRGRRDRIYVTRSDSSTLSWDFPSYGDGLPHDLVHLVVETGLGMVDGFWGLVDSGVDVTLMDNQASLVREGRLLVDEPGFDAASLRRAEEAVAVIGATDAVDSLPGWLSATTAVVIRDRLAEVGRRWRQLEDGVAIMLSFEGGAMLERDGFIAYRPGDGAVGGR
jgi:hypothetical protein